MIDADERLRAGDAEKLRAFVRRGACDFAHVPIESVVEAETLITRGIRLFRNFPGLAYRGKIHEQILPALESIGRRFHLRSSECPARLVHLGYDPGLFASRAKSERNARLLAEEIRENPANAYALLKHGEILLAHGRLAEAAASLEAAWRMTVESVRAGVEARLLEEPATLFAACAVARGEHPTALEILDEFHRLASPTTNTLYLEGVALWALGRPGAKERLTHCLSHHEDAGELFTLPEIKGATPRFLLASIALESGESARAVEWFEQALERDGSHRESRLGLAEAQFHAGKVDRAVHTLAVLLRDDPTEVRAWQAGGIYLRCYPSLAEAACSWLLAAARACPSDPVIERLCRDASVAPAEPAPVAG
jgi:tetratricopeptide (TPR) repeat protein